eukprot:TRINITY_DN12763_c0_g1_i4.p1 TRINITY_DN12763_c0_g1~~TRINITY_DN12763_c0_g1_i4.p1  ORF type:complete len:145 (+),score=16.52 TRINITY_DN12763_c0_g1_i4:130-564(+)
MAVVRLCDVIFYAVGVTYLLLAAAYLLVPDYVFREAHIDLERFNAYSMAGLMHYIRITSVLIITTWGLLFMEGATSRGFAVATALSVYGTVEELLIIRDMTEIAPPLHLAVLYQNTWLFAGITCLCVLGWVLVPSDLNTKGKTQ